MAMEVRYHHPRESQPSNEGSKTFTKDSNKGQRDLCSLEVQQYKAWNVPIQFINMEIIDDFWMSSFCVGSFHIPVGWEEIVKSSVKYYFKKIV